MFSFEDYAAEKLNVPKGWRCYSWDSGLDTGTERVPANMTRIEGCVCPNKLRGKYKGRPNWKKKDKQTVRVFFIDDADFKAWRDAKEKATGTCFECNNTGAQWAGWSAIHGDRYRDCGRCGRKMQQAGTLPESP